jgi:hypothetical protein
MLRVLGYQKHRLVLKEEHKENLLLLEMLGLLLQAIKRYKEQQQGTTSSYMIIEVKEQVHKRIMVVLQPHLLMMLTKMSSGIRHQRQRILVEEIISQETAEGHKESHQQGN